MPKTHAETWEWRFDQPPEAVWPALADTSRWNEAAGIPRHAIEEREEDDGAIRYFGSAKIGPLPLRWEEIPVEWVFGTWFRHVRQFLNGPIAVIDATLSLAADGPGTLATYHLAAAPRGPLGHALLSTAFFPACRKNFTGLADGVRDWLEGRRDGPFASKLKSLDAAQRGRLERAVAAVEAGPDGHGLAPRLAEWLATAQEVDQMKLRPLALARTWDADAQATVEMFFAAVDAGLLDQQWDLLCPRCRGAKATAPALDRLPAESHCGACNIDYERDFAKNVELSFRPNAAIRDVPDGEYCLFGPMTTPHIRVQVGVEPGETRAVAATLAAGPYRLRTLQVGDEVEIEHDGRSFPDVVFDGADVRTGGPGAAGEIVFRNDGPRRRTMIVESLAWTADALTAHRATTLQAFRDRFGDEVLRPGDNAAVGRIALMFTDLGGSTAFYERVGDAHAYAVVRDHFELLAATVRTHGGAVVKTIGDAVMAAFPEPAHAVAAALDIQGRVAAFNDGHADDDALVIKVGVHAGPAIAVTLNRRLDYFGSTVNLAARLEGQSHGGDIVVSLAVADDADVATVLDGIAAAREVAQVRGIADPVAFVRLRP